MSPDRMTDHSRSRRNPARLARARHRSCSRPNPDGGRVRHHPIRSADVRLRCAGGLEGYLPAEGGQPSPVWYPLAYAVRLVLVAALCWWYRATWSDFRPWPKAPALILAVLVGLVVWGLWIGLDGHYPALPFLGKRGGFDVETLAPRWRPAFIAVRMLGLVDPRPADRRAFLAVVSDPLADRPGFSQGPDRTRHAAGGGDHVGHVCPGASRMAAGPLDGLCSGRGCSGEHDHSPPVRSATPRPTSRWVST